MKKQAVTSSSLFPHQITPQIQFHFVSEAPRSGSGRGGMAPGRRGGGHLASRSFIKISRLVIPPLALETATVEANTLVLATISA